MLRLRHSLITKIRSTSYQKFTVVKASAHQFLVCQPKFFWVSICAQVYGGIGIQCLKVIWKEINTSNYLRLFFFEPAYEVLAGRKTLVGQTSLP